MDDFRLPDVQPVIRDGESVVELRQNGELVGHINFTRILQHFWQALRSRRSRSERHLRVVK